MLVREESGFQLPLSPTTVRAPCPNAIFAGQTTAARPAEPRQGFLRQRAAPTRSSSSRSRPSCTTGAVAARTSTGGRARTPWWLLKRPQRATRRGQRRLDAAAARADATADRARSTRCASQRHARARAPACAHAHAGGLSRSPGAMGGPSSARGGGGGARSLGRSRARGVALVMAVGVAVGYTEHHARHARRASRGRTRTSSPLRARHHRLPPPPRTTGTRALLRRRRSLARSIARSRARGVALAVEVAFSYTARHARHARRASRARSAYVITDFRSLRAQPARARCGGGGARSIARSRARGVA